MGLVFEHGELRGELGKPVRARKFLHLARRVHKPGCAKVGGRPFERVRRTRHFLGSPFREERAHLALPLRAVFEKKIPNLRKERHVVPHVTRELAKVECRLPF